MIRAATDDEIRQIDPRIRRISGLGEYDLRGSGSKKAPAKKKAATKAIITRYTTKKTARGPVIKRFKKP
jgi:hypothetical protein